MDSLVVNAFSVLIFGVTDDLKLHSVSMETGINVVHWSIGGECDRCGSNR